VLTPSAPTYAPAHTHQQEEHNWVKISDISVEFLAKLQNVEQSMSLSNGTPNAKPSHTAKRRQLPLF